MTKKKTPGRPPTPEELGAALRAIQQRSLEEMQAAYQKGAKIKLLEAAVWCGKCGLKLPAWVAAGLAAALEDYSTCAVRTLDEAFCIPSRKPGFHTKPRNKFFKKSISVYIRVLTLWKDGRKGGRGLGDALFDDVGEEFGINGKKVETFFYHWREILGPPIRKAQRTP